MEKYRIARPDHVEAETPIAIMLHGVGSSMHDLWDLLEPLKDKLILLSVQGDITYGQGFAYFLPDPQGQTSQAVIEEGVKRVDERIQSILESEHLSQHPLYLFGFSQGAMLSQSLIADPKRPYTGAILSHSRFLGYLPASDLRQRQVFILQGRQDPLFPPPHGEQIRDYFTNQGAKVKLETYESGHGLTQQAWRDILSWFNEIL